LLLCLCRSVADELIADIFGSSDEEEEFAVSFYVCFIYLFIFANSMQTLFTRIVCKIQVDAYPLVCVKVRLLIIMTCM
jgi:hypothetical protein